MKNVNSKKYVVLINLEMRKNKKYTSRSAFIERIPRCFRLTI